MITGITVPANKRACGSGNSLTRDEALAPDVHYGDVRHFATEDTGVSEWLVTGTLPSGVAVNARGCDHYEFREGKVVRKDSYWKIVE